MWLCPVSGIAREEARYSRLFRGQKARAFSATSVTSMHQRDQIAANSVERISADGIDMSIIVHAEFRERGIHFFTDDTLSQQLAFMSHPTGKLIAPHIHNPVPREVQFTLEVLFIRKGKLRVDFYDMKQHYLESRVLGAGDAILLMQGGHGFEVIEDVEMIEVKQGPYVGEQDKTRFIGIDSSQVKLPE
jgi:mannose-6-phosphate isomerase-like protein (cupin superfamily)